MPRQGFIGLDVAKDTFTAAFRVVDALSGAIQQSHLETFSYDLPGWQRFLATWDTFQADFWWVGLEASGPYSALLEAHLLRSPRPHLSLHRLSPLQVRDFARARSRRRAKTDRLDAYTIALFLRQQLTVQALPAPLQHYTPLRALAHLDPHLAQELTRIPRAGARLPPLPQSPAHPPAPLSFCPRHRPGPPPRSSGPPPIPSHPGPGGPPGPGPGFLRPPRPYPGANPLAPPGPLGLPGGPAGPRPGRPAAGRPPASSPSLAPPPGHPRHRAPPGRSLPPPRRPPRPLPRPQSPHRLCRPRRHPPPIRPLDRPLSPLQTGRPPAPPRPLPHRRGPQTLHPSLRPGFRLLPPSGASRPRNPGHPEPQSIGNALSPPPPSGPLPGPATTRTRLSLIVDSCPQDEGSCFSPHSGGPGPTGAVAGTDLRRWTMKQRAGLPGSSAPGSPASGRWAPGAESPGSSAARSPWPRPGSA
jgi:hypothetical protein